MPDVTYYQKLTSAVRNWTNHQRTINNADDKIRDLSKQIEDLTKRKTGHERIQREARVKRDQAGEICKSYIKSDRAEYIKTHDPNIIIKVTKDNVEAIILVEPRENQ